MIASMNASAQWCPVCKHYHTTPGEKQDNGKLVRRCPKLSQYDPRNQYENYPGGR